MSGVDLTSVDAIGVETVQVVLSEYGTDLNRFATEKEFVSHLTLTPHRTTNGGKPVKKKRRSMASTHVAGALRIAALSLRNSVTEWGAYYPADRATDRRRRRRVRYGEEAGHADLPPAALGAAVCR
jgi:transposase